MRQFTPANNDLLTGTSLVTAYPVTFAAWFRYNTKPTANNAQRIASLNTSPAGNSFCGLVTQSNASGVTFMRANAQQTNGVGASAIGTVPLQNGVLYHGCAILGASNSRIVFTNGVDRQTNTTGITLGTMATTVLGQNGSNGGQFNGWMGEVAIWNLALTDDEVKYLAGGLSPLAIHRPNLIHYYPLKDGNSPELDVVSAQNLTVTGTVPSRDFAEWAAYPQIALTPQDAALGGAR